MKKFLAVFVLFAMLFSFAFSISSETSTNSITIAAKTYSQTYSERSELTQQQLVQKVSEKQYVKSYDSKLIVNPSGITISDLLKPDKAFETKDEWYKLENQPPFAIKITSEKVPETVEKTVSVFIGKTYAIVNGNTTTLDAPPQIIPPGRTYVPVRFIAENLGYSVSWDGKERKVTLSSEDKLIELWINKKKVRVNGLL